MKVKKWMDSSYVDSMKEESVFDQNNVKIQLYWLVLDTVISLNFMLMMYKYILLK